MSFRGPITRGTILTSAVLGLRLLVQAGTLLLLAHLLGPAGFGTLAGLASLAVVMGTLSNFGTHLVALAEIAKRPGDGHRILSHALPTTLICGTLLLAAYVAICWIAYGSNRAPFAVVLAIGLAELLLQPLLGLVAMGEMARGRTALSQLIYTVPLLLRMIVAALLMLYRPDEALQAFAIAYVGVAVMSLLVSLAFTSTKWPPMREWSLPSGRDLRRSAGYAATSFTAMGPGEVDKTLSTILLPSIANGIYAAAARIIGATTLPVTAMTLSALPRLLRENATQPASPSRLTRWVFGSALLYGLALAIAIWTLAPALALLFGTSYQGIAEVIRLLALAVPGMSIRIAAGSTLLATDRPWTRVGFEASGLCMLVLASVTLTGDYGAQGMPLALIASEWTMAVIGSLCVFRARGRT